MKLRAILLLLFLCLPAAWGRDVIVMVDVSASLAPCFTSLVDYLESDLLARKLENGVVAHILSFSTNPRLEMTLPIEGEETRMRVFRKIDFLQPIGLHTDLVRAVEFLLEYADGLPAGAPKEVYLLTDGIHDPPPGSRYDVDADSILAKLLEDAQTIKRQGWEVHLLRMPSAASVDGTDSFAEETDRSERRSYLDDFGEELEVEVVPYPEGQEAAAIGDPQAGKIPDAGDPDEERTEGEIIEPDGGQVYGQPPDRRERTADEAGDGLGRLRVPLFVLIGILAAFLVGAAALLLRKRLSSKMERIQDAGKPGYGRKPKGQVVEMRVQGQNTRIGFRNVHRIRANRHKSVGGGRSHFLIFLVPFPPHVADIHFDGEKYRFVPRKGDYFPDLEGELDDCLDREISARSKRGTEVLLKFRRYVSPLEEINRILTLTIQHLLFGSS